MNDTSIVGKIVDDLAENTGEIHECNKGRLAEHRKTFSERHAAATAPQPGVRERFEQEKEAFRERRAEATKPDPGVEKVKQAKGIGGKASAIVENIVEGARESKENERQRRADIIQATNPKS